MKKTKRTLTFPEPLRLWVSAIADRRGITFAEAAIQILQAAKEQEEQK